MKRTGFRPCTEGMATTAKLSVPVFRPRTCAKAKGGCGERFTPARQMQSACSPACARGFVEAANTKKAKNAAEADRRRTREQLEAIKTKPMLLREAEKAMNKWVRLRDFSAGCISCGSVFEPGSIGGACDAGHFRSKGSAPHLRFDERNLHGQCKHCNQYLAGNPIGYEWGLVARIGNEAVDALKRDQEAKKYSRDDLRAMRDDYRRRVCQMEKS